MLHKEVAEVSSLIKSACLPYERPRLLIPFFRIHVYAYFLKHAVC